jgi:hypothetical protein
MPKITAKHQAVIDAFARMGADITQARGGADRKRLQSAIASALREQLRAKPSITAPPPPHTELALEVPDSERAALLRDVDSLGDAAGHGEALAIVRRDPRERLLSARLIDSLTALKPAERIGPFGTLGGIDIWFDLFAAAHRTEVRETGATAPAMVITQARPPVTRHSVTTITIEAGTVWIRGNLISGSLPAGSFAGIKVTGGSFRTSQHVTTVGDNVEVAAPLKGELKLQLAVDEVTPAIGACSSADTKVKLPDSLTFTFNGGSVTTVGTAGTAKAWGQTFKFGPSTGTWTFMQPLWTVVLSYDVAPTQFDADPIGDDLVHFDGKGDIDRAGLGLPVVVAPAPAVLGEVAFAPSWVLQIKQLTARWYQPDTRLHDLNHVWIGISAFGAVIFAEHIAPLAPPVIHSYDLWTVAGGTNKRLPWRQTYRQPFLLFYRCHAVEGEDFLVQGQAKVALDRPVTTNGIPVSTPATQSTLLLHKFGGTITATLGALIEDPNAIHQFALSNALVWTGAPAFLFVSGELLSPAQIDNGTAQLIFGVYGWSPTLPDPYVSNAFVRRPRRLGIPQALLLARVSWAGPDHVTVSFEGQLGPGISLEGRPPSPGDPRPAHEGGRQPDTGLTQVEQASLTFDKKTEADRKNAQGAEAHGRALRNKVAEGENAKSSALIDGFLREVIGPAPNLTLLDVSTNQDMLGVAVGVRPNQDAAPNAPVSSSGFPVSDLAVQSEVGGMRVVMLPQVQWEPVRTLDADQNIMTMGWFPTPLASATDGGATQIGTRSQKLMPIIPESALRGTFDAFKEGRPVGVRTTFPFGLISAIRLEPNTTPARKADLYQLTRPKFPNGKSRGGIQVTAKAEGGRPDDGGISPTFEGQMRQLLNGVDLASGAPLGISVLGETLQPAGSVETIFNDDMTARPRVPVTRIDLSGYGGSNFSDWNNPFAAFAEAAKVQFKYTIGRTALEVIKVNSVLHPWGIRVTRSVTIERRPGGGVVRRDSGWQAFTPGIFDYRYFDKGANAIVVAPYTFDAGVFRGLFNARTIRPAPGNIFNHGGATLVPYYFDAEVTLEGVPGRTTAFGILGYLQTTPNGVPAGVDALQALIEAQGPIGGPIEAWMNFGGSGLPFRAQRVEVGLAIDAGNPLFVATVRGVPSLPTTGAWSVAVRPVASVPPNGGEAAPVAENRGVPVIRRYPIKFLAGDSTPYTEPRLGGTPGDYRFADPVDLLTPSAPQNDYALLQTTPTHSFLFPRPFVPAASAPRIESGHKSALADIFSRATSKGAFPPPVNTMEMPAGSLHFNVGPSGKLALSPPLSIVGFPNPLRIGGTPGHGSVVFYDLSTIRLELDEDRWEAEFTGVRVWHDITGLEKLTGSEMRIVGSTDQRSQIAEIKSLMLQQIEDILQYIPIFGQRGVQGPVDLGATNAKHELKVEVGVEATVPPPAVIATFPAGTGVVLKLSVKSSTGIDIATGGPKASAVFGAQLDGKVPLLSLGVAAVFLIITGKITFSLTSVSGAVTAEKLDLLAFVGVGVEGKIGPFKAYAFLGIGFVLTYDAIAKKTKYGGLVALEAGVALVIVSVKIRAELKGVVYKDAGKTKCDYAGSVKIEVEIFLIFSINASYEVSDTKALM